MQSILSMKTDNNSFDTDSAALLRNAYTGFRPCTLAYNCTEDTRLLFQLPSYCTSRQGHSAESIWFPKKRGNCGRHRHLEAWYDLWLIIGEYSLVLAALFPLAIDHYSSMLMDELKSYCRQPINLFHRLGCGYQETIVSSGLGANSFPSELRAWWIWCPSGLRIPEHRKDALLICYTAQNFIPVRI
jgi:hypothetical protein